MPLRSGEVGGVFPGQEDVRRPHDVAGHADGILHGLDDRDSARLHAGVHQSRVHLSAAVEPHPRSGPGIQARIVLEDDDRLDDGIEGRAAGFQHGEPSRPRPIRRILRRGIRSGPAMREEDRAHAPGTEEVAFNFSAAFGPSASREH